VSKIIIGYQEDERADDALALGRVLAEILDARPVVVAVATWPAYLLTADERDAALHQEFDEVLEVARDRLRDLNPDTRVAEANSVAGELIAVAEDQKAAAIVIGSSHHGTLGRVALGSVGSSLVHGAPCAVAVARSGLAAEDDRHLLRIGVAFDGSPEAWGALEAAIGVTERTHGRLTVVTVADFPSYGLGSAWSVFSAGELADAEHKNKQRILDLALGRVPAELPVEGRLFTGPAGSLLAETSGELDLLIMGSRSYGPIGRTFLGGTATHLIHSAQCSVMVLPRGVSSDPFELGNRASRMTEPA
jgi:nucleotide-binding universal stress UspA family protein